MTLRPSCSSCPSTKRDQPRRLVYSVVRQGQLLLCVSSLRLLLLGPLRLFHRLKDLLQEEDSDYEEQGIGVYPDYEDIDAPWRDRGRAEILDMDHCA